MARQALRACLMLFIAAYVGAGTPTAAQQGGGGTLVVTNKGAASASIIDVASGNTHATVPTGAGPHEVVLTADGRTAVVTDYGAQQGGNTLTVIDVAGRRVARTVDLGQHRRPHGIAFLPGDSLVAVTSEASRNVVIVHPASGQIRRVIPTQNPGSHMLAFGTAADRIYTGDMQSNTVSVLDPATGEYLRSFPVPPVPEAIGVPPDGRQVWVGSNEEGTVNVLDPSTGEVRRAAEGLGWPYRIVFTPDGRRVLLPDYRGEELRVLDRESFRELARLSFPGEGPQGITVTTDGRWAFLSLSRANQVAVLDLSTLEVVRRIATGQGPDGVAWSSESPGSAR
jgi:DNA-binding beta-propeller fold protein YncE